MYDEPRSWTNHCWNKKITKLQKITLDEIWIKVELIRRNQQVRYIRLSGQTSHYVIDQSMIRICDMKNTVWRWSQVHRLQYKFDIYQEKIHQIRCIVLICFCTFYCFKYFLLNSAIGLDKGQASILTFSQILVVQFTWHFSFGCIKYRSCSHFIWHLLILSYVP